MLHWMMAMDDAALTIDGSTVSPMAAAAANGMSNLVNRARFIKNPLEKLHLGRSATNEQCVVCDYEYEQRIS